MMEETETELRKTLDELEGVVWGEPEWDSGLVTRCHELRTKPIGEFTVGDLCVMIGQRISVPILLPLALDILEREPFADAEYYPGDLLESVLGMQDEWWERHAEWHDRICRVIRRCQVAPSEVIERVATFGARWHCSPGNSQQSKTQE